VGVFISELIHFIENGKILTMDRETGIMVDNEQKAPVHRYQYDLRWRDLIIAYMLDGKRLKDIGNIEGMPNHACIMRWRLMNPDFDEKINEVRRIMAEDYHDRALEAATSPADEDTRMDQRKLAVETLKWAAERNDPMKFGGSTKILGDKNAPIGLYVLNTGIDRGVPNEPTTIRDINELCTEITYESVLPAEEEIQLPSIPSTGGEDSGADQRHSGRGIEESTTEPTLCVPCADIWTSEEDSVGLCEAIQQEPAEMRVQGVGVEAGDHATKGHEEDRPKRKSNTRRRQDKPVAPRSRES
jgi:hypothetical protein